MAASHSDVCIRVARPDDYNRVAEISMLAFADDPLVNYFTGTAKLFDVKDDLKAYEDRTMLHSFFVNAVVNSGGRITIVVDNEENIRAGCLWLPPQKRLGKWKLHMLYNAGMLSVLQRWGMGTFWRIFNDYEGPSEISTNECYKACGSEESPMDSWYLQMTFTHPDHQGKGYLSLLLREAFAHAPDCAFTLESTTPKSRARYLHLGFEQPTPIIIGHGKADAQGLTASGEVAVGVECWAMVRWPSVKRKKEDPTA